MSDQLIGQTIDRYQVVAQLGEGQWGAVYRAFDPNLQRDVALTLIRLPENQPDVADAITRQARLAAQLDHPGLAKVHDFASSGPWLYIVTDYLPGGNLAQLLQDLRTHNQWLPLAEAVGLTRQLALILNGLPPRSLTPTDVFLKPDVVEGVPFRAVLTGLALQPETPGAGGWPANPNAPAPAYAYWSPEQALGQPLDARSEVYVLGALLYELAVSWQPFPAQSAAEASRLHMQSAPPAPPAPRSRRADLPPALDALILKALEKDPANRYPDPAALAQALSEILPSAQAVDQGLANSAWIVSLLVPFQRLLSAAAATAAVPAAAQAAAASTVAAATAAAAAQAAAAVQAAATQAAPAANALLQQADGRAFYRFNGVVVDANLVQTSPDGSLGVYAEVPQFTVTPGEPTSTGLVVVNLGPDLEHVSLSTSGLPGGWLAAPLPPTSIPLGPGESRRVTVTIAPPRSPASRAGRYSLVVRAAKQSQPDQAVEAKLALTVAAFAQFESEISAATVEAGQPARLQVHNQGNTPESYTVTFDDPSTRVMFDPPDMVFSVPEGQMAAADFIVRRRGTRLVGDGRTYPFGLRVTSSSGLAQVLTSEVNTHALLPAWLLLVGIFGCCLILGATVLVLGGKQRDADSTATALAQGTGNAIAQATIRAQGTRLALLGTNTPTSTGTSTLPAVTTTGTYVPPTATPTPLPATPSNTPPAASGTAPAPTDTVTAAPTATSTSTSTAVPPSPTLTLAPPTATLTLAPPATATTAPAAGGRVVFAAPAAGQPNLFSINGDGSGTVPLTTGGANQNPAWSNAAQRLAFESTRDGNSEIYSMKADGSDQIRLTNNAAADTAPVWSSDGAHIAFVSDRDGNPEIYVMNPDGSAQTRLTNNPAADTQPAWAPDNAHLAFISARDGNPELYIMDANGANPTRLTTDPDPEDAPSWAPNGAWLAYVRGTGAAAEIYLTTAQGAGQLQLTNNAFPDTQPKWAPNASRLAFVSERDGNSEIYTMLADGSAQTRLTNSAGRDDHPIWSPLGDRLAFASDRDGLAQVYLMNPDGSAQTRLTNDGNPDLPAIWLP